VGIATKFIGLLFYLDLFVFQRNGKQSYQCTNEVDISKLIDVGVGEIYVTATCPICRYIVKCNRWFI